MTNEMIDRCTRALAEVTDDINGYSNEEAVLAVIKAMREPTEEMIKAGELIGVEYGYISDHDYKSIWQRQIDEILK